MFLTIISSFCFTQCWSEINFRVGHCILTLSDIFRNDLQSLLIIITIFFLQFSPPPFDTFSLISWIRFSIWMKSRWLLIVFVFANRKREFFADIRSKIYNCLHLYSVYEYFWRIIITLIFVYFANTFCSHCTFFANNTIINPGTDAQGGTYSRPSFVLCIYRPLIIYKSAWIWV